MSREFLRVYKDFDVSEVQKHLMIMGDLKADCASCRTLGMDPYTARQCPGCGTSFKYFASRRMETHPGERFQIARRIQEKQPDLVILDYADYAKALGQRKARDFFG